MIFLAEIQRLKIQINKLERMLSDDGFLKKASETVITLNKQKVLDFTNTLNKVMGQVMSELRLNFESDERIQYHIEYLRESNYLTEKNITLENCQFDTEYFDTIYKTEITKSELAELCDKITHGKAHIKPL